MAGEQLQQPQQATAQDQEGPKAKHDINIALVHQPQTPEQAKALEKSRQVIIETQNGLRCIPAEVAAELLPMPTLQYVRKPDDAVFKALTLPHNHTYNGEQGLGVQFKPEFDPADKAIAQFEQGLETGNNGRQDMFDQFALYGKCMTVDLGDSWQHFQQEMQNSHDPTKLSWDDALAGDKSIGTQSTNLATLASDELAAISVVQDVQAQMTGLIGEISKLNLLLQKLEKEQKLDQLQSEIASKDKAAQTMQSKETEMIDAVLGFGLSLCSAGTLNVATLALEGGKASAKMISGALHKHIFKSNDLQKLQNEIVELSSRRDLLKTEIQSLEKEAVVTQLDSVSKQFTTLNQASISAYQTVAGRMQASDSANSDMASATSAFEGEQKMCGGKGKKCEAPEGDYQSASIFAGVRQNVSATIPQLNDSTLNYQTALTQYQLAEKARRAEHFAQEQGPRFNPTDPALAQEYKQFRDSADRAVRLYQYWANTAEAEMHNAQEIGNHTGSFKAQKALALMQLRFNSGLTNEKNKMNQR